MKLYLPNSAHLQNINGFIRKYSPEGENSLSIEGHPRYIHIHPFAMAMAACAGASFVSKGVKPTGGIPNVSSAPYLVRMKLFDFLGVPSPCEIEEHEDSGRFVPLTQIQTSGDLRGTISNLIPLLHAPQSVADPIRYVVSELGRNVLEHAESDVGGFVCAQYFKNQKRIAIGIADSGKGIFNAMSRFHKVADEKHAVRLALTPGVSGATSKIGGNETNAGAGLFFIRSIAKVSGNFFVMYSGRTLYKIMRKQPRPGVLFLNPFEESHSLVTDLPHWKGTVIGIDINVDETAKFSSLLEIISKSYRIDVASQKKKFYKKIKFK